MLVAGCGASPALASPVAENGLRGALVSVVVAQGLIALELLRGMCDLSKLG